MILADIAATPWVKQLQSLLDYHVTAIPQTPAVIAGGAVAVLVGLLMVLRSAKLSQSMVTAFGLSLGVWIGYQLSQYVGTPKPITCAIAALVIAAIAYRWHRVWLAAGSVAALFGLALLFQLGRGDLQRYLPTLDTFERARAEGSQQLVSKEEQLRNLKNDVSDHLHKVGDKVVVEMKNLGARGWLLPAAAAILGGLLAWWGLNIFAVVWMGLLGSIIAVAGGSTLISAFWPDMRADITSHPEYLGASIAGLWLLGLVFQAKEARFPRTKAAAAAKPAAKS